MYVDWIPDPRSTDDTPALHYVMSYIVTRVRESVRNLANIWCYMQHSRNVASRACCTQHHTTAQQQSERNIFTGYPSFSRLTLSRPSPLPRISNVIAHALVSKSIDRASARILSPFLVVQVVAHVTVRTFLLLLNSGFERVVVAGDNVRCNDICCLLTASPSSIVPNVPKSWIHAGCFDPNSIETLNTLTWGGDVNSIIRAFLQSWKTRRRRITSLNAIGDSRRRIKKRGKVVWREWHEGEKGRRARKV